MPGSREEHLQWTKQRALVELEADPDGCGPQNSITSLLSDLRKHPETKQHGGFGITAMLLFGGHLNTASRVREHIEGFQ